MSRTNKNSDYDIYMKAVVLGAVAGLRTFMAPAFLSYAATRSEKHGLGDGFFAHPIVSVATVLLAAGELVGDKLPSTPNRTNPAPLTARIVSAAVVGGSICAAHKKSVPTGIALGACAAVASAFAGQEIRAALSRQTGVSSAVFGAIEDAIAFGIAASALKKVDDKSA